MPTSMKKNIILNFSFIYEAFCKTRWNWAYVKINFCIKENLMKISFQSCLFHINRTFGSHDMAIYILDLYRCLKKNNENQVKQIVKLINLFKIIFILFSSYSICIVNISNLTKINKFKNVKISPHSVFCLFFTIAPCPFRVILAERLTYHHDCNQNV